VAADRTPSARRTLNVLRALGAAILSALAVVLLPSEAWGAPPVLPSRAIITTPHTAVLDFGGTYTGTVPVTFNLSATGQPTLSSAGGVTFALAAGTKPTGNLRLQYRCAGLSTWVTWWSYTIGSATSTGPATGSYSCASVVDEVRIVTESGYLTYAPNATVWGPMTTNTPDVSSCPSSFGSTTATSYVGTTFTGLVKWVGTAPAGGWKVYAPGGSYGWPGASPTPSLSVGTTAGTTPGEYTNTATIAAGSMTGVAFARIEKASDPTCFTVVAVSSTGVTSSPTNNGTDDEGADCGINVFCTFSAALSSAFTPSASTLDDWDSLKDDAGRVVPFGYISDSLSLLAYLDDGCASGSGCYADKLTTGFCFDAVIGNTFGDLDSDPVCPFAEGTPVRSWLESQRTLMGTFAWAAVLAPLVGWVWRKSVPFINSGS